MYAGIHEIAEELGVSRQSVCNWTKRYPSFPKPIVRLKMGPIYNMSIVKKWYSDNTRTTLHVK